MKEGDINLGAIFQSLVSEFEAMSKIAYEENDLFTVVIKAAYIKCFEFNLFVNQATSLKESFYLLGTLRSICEDLISITYLLTTKNSIEREEIIKFSHNFEMHNSLIKQYDFLHKYNPGQLIIIPENILNASQIEFVKGKPKNNKEALKKGYNVLPSVYEMAEKTGYEDMYKYLYYFTSSLVHFRPDVLLKSGWGDEKVEGNKVTRTATVSFKNYNQYYYCVNQYYALFLFIEQTKRFRACLGILCT